MGVLDKIKNLFYDEEVIEVPNEKVRIESNTSNSKIEVEEKKDSIDNVISERDLVKTETNFKFPVIFEDEDFIDKKPINNSKEKIQHSRVDENQKKYKKPTLDREVIKEVIEKPKKFTPSPVISPVYGVLDKNYKKDDINKNNKDDLDQTKELVINFDTIRQKAYGSLTDEIENELYSSSNKISEIEKEIDDILVENNLLTDLEEDPVEEVKNIEIEKEDEYSYSDFGVEYKISEDTTEKEVKLEDESKKEDKETLEEDVINQDDEKQVELTEDLFNLIDSMYDR